MVIDIMDRMWPSVMNEYNFSVSETKNSKKNFTLPKITKPKASAVPRIWYRIVDLHKIIKRQKKLKLSKI